MDNMNNINNINNIKLLKNYIISNCQEKYIYNIIEKYYKELYYSRLLFKIKIDYLNTAIFDNKYGCIMPYYKYDNLLSYIILLKDEYNIDKNFMEIHYNMLQKFITNNDDYIDIFGHMEINYSPNFIKEHIKKIKHTCNHFHNKLMNPDIYYNGELNKYAQDSLTYVTMLQKYGKYMSKN